jgi:hypothetical protein
MEVRKEAGNWVFQNINFVGIIQKVVISALRDARDLGVSNVFLQYSMCCHRMCNFSRRHYPRLSCTLPLVPVRIMDQNYLEIIVLSQFLTCFKIVTIFEITVNSKSFLFRNNQLISKQVVISKKLEWFNQSMKTGVRLSENITHKIQAFITISTIIHYSRQYRMWQRNGQIMIDDRSFDFWDLSKSVAFADRHSFAQISWFGISNISDENRSKTRPVSILNRENIIIYEKITNSWNGSNSKQKSDFQHAQLKSGQLWPILLTNSQNKLNIKFQLQLTNTAVFRTTSFP